ncbi:MAG: DMT family transporter [Alphaproteobacteria bacterium]
MQPKTKDWALLFGLAAIWGLSFPVLSIAVETVPPSTTVAVRMVIGAITIWLIMKLRGLSFPREIRLIVIPALVGIIGNAVPFTLISWGQAAVGASLAGILMAIMPLGTLILAHFFSEGERMNTRGLTGFGLGFAGIILLMGPSALNGLGDDTLIRQVSILAGALCYAVSAIIARRAAAIDPIVSTTIALISGALVMVPFSLIVDQPWTAQPDLPALLSLLYLGVAATALGNFVYFLIASRTGAGFLSLTNYLIPVLAVLFSIMMLAEMPSALSLAALGIILVGVWLSQRDK